jgi:hypothetical protein
MTIARSLRFNKHTYDYYDVIPFKLKAKQEANKLRDRGYLVRIIDSSSGYVLYRKWNMKRKLK